MSSTILPHHASQGISPWPRGLARTVDVTLLAGAALALAVTGVAALPAHSAPLTAVAPALRPAAAWLPAEAAAFGFGAASALTLVLLAAHLTLALRGASLGKQLLGLRVETQQGTRPGLRGAAREAILWLPLAAPPVGLAWLAVNGLFAAACGRGLHDMLTGTRVRWPQPRAFGRTLACALVCTIVAAPVYAQDHPWPRVYTRPTPAHVSSAPRVGAAETTLRLSEGPTQSAPPTEASTSDSLLHATTARAHASDTRAHSATARTLADEAWIARRSGLILDLLHGDPATRWTAAIELGNAGPAASEAVSALRTALHDRSWVVRRCAATALGEIGDARATSSLDRVARLDHRHEVRVAARTSLAALHVTR